MNDTILRQIKELLLDANLHSLNIDQDKANPVNARLEAQLIFLRINEALDLIDDELPEDEDVAPNDART